MRVLTTTSPASRRLHGARVQVRSLAFAHVRTLVDALVAGRSVPKVCPGMEVTLTGLTSAGGVGLNGQRAMCLAVPEDPADRITIRVIRSGVGLVAVLRRIGWRTSLLPCTWARHLDVGWLCARVTDASCTTSSNHFVQSKYLTRDPSLTSDPAGHLPAALI